MAEGQQEQQQQPAEQPAPEPAAAAEPTAEPEEEVVDAEVVHDEPAGEQPAPASTEPPAAEPEQPPATGAALVPTAPASGAIIKADTPDEVLTKATEIANVLKGLIDKQNLSASMGGGKKHVEIGAWQACGAMLGALGGEALHAETVWTRPVRDPETGQLIVRKYDVKETIGKGEKQRVLEYEVEGHDWEACVEIKTAAGVVVGRAEAMVSRSESKWSKRDEYAVRSMAETRAASRAYRNALGWIVAIAGFEQTPLEEMPDGKLKPVPEGKVPEASSALMALVGDHAGTAEKAWNRMRVDGALPDIVADALILVAKASAAVAQHKAQQQAQPAQPAGEQPAPTSTEPPAEKTEAAREAEAATTAAKRQGGQPPADDPEKPGPGTVEDTPENRERWCKPIGCDPKGGQKKDECPVHGIPF